MRAPLSVIHDPARLKALRDAVRPRAYPAMPYDELTRVAARAIDAPLVLVSLVDDSGQFAHGLHGQLGEVAVCRAQPMSDSICKHVVTSGMVLRIADCRVHPLTCTMPIVEALQVVGYLGLPLTTSDGHTLGSLCAITMQPRDWSPADESVLRDLAKVVLSDLELRAELSHREDVARASDPSITNEGLPARGVDILDGMLSGAVVLDREWRITFANRRAARLLGVPRGAFVGQSAWTAFPALVGGPVEQHLRAAANSRRPVDVEILLRDMDRWCRLRVVPARHGLTVYFQDTTEQRRAVEALAVREEQLRQAQKMEAIGALAGGIAHDFNNLLTVVRANSELLLAAASAGDASRVPLSEIAEAASRATALTQQLLAFGRKQVTQPRVLQLGTAVDTLLPMLRRLVPANIALEAQQEPDLPMILADPGQMEQVVLNLVLNARDAMPAGGRIMVQSRACETDRALTVATGELPRGAWVMLSVEDSGAGIAPEHIPRLFEPFFTTKPVGQGTGLGLATVFGIVREAGGYVGVHSAPGEGARFDVYLPVSQGEPVTAAVLQAPAARAVRQECLLVVEDESPVRGVVQRVLAGDGYELLFATNGAEAMGIYAANRERIDLVLTDIVMPDASGIELATFLQNADASLPIVLMSGYGDVGPLQEHVANGLPLLAKPFNAESLRRIVRETLDDRVVVFGH